MEPSVRTRVMVREVMNSPVITASPDETVQAVASKMADLKVGSVVVMDGERPIGIVTDGDIVLKCVARDLKPSEVKAKDIMSQPLHTVESDEDVTEAAKMMRRLGIKRLGVVYKDALMGIVSSSDLVAVTPELVEVMSEKARVMAGGMKRGAGYLAGYCDLCNQWSDYLLGSEGKFLCDECRVEAEKEA